MKTHVLGQLGKAVRENSLAKIYYDIKSQISYWDKEFKIPVISVSRHNLIVPNTKISETVEDSDVDEFNLCGGSTYTTRSIENGDTDEFLILEPTTKQTFIVEDSDVDEFALGF